MAVVNSRVLADIGIDDVSVPPGGTVSRDDAGRPTGLLLENAQLLVRGLVYPYPLAEVAGAIERATAQYVTEGVTSIQEAGVGGGLISSGPQELAAYARARADGRLHVRATLMVAADVLHELGSAAGDPPGFGLDLGLTTGFGDDALRLGPVKVFADGSLVGRTAAMHEPFADDPGNTGALQSDPEQLHALLLAAHRNGWQIATHAIGDRAVSTVLDGYEAAQRAHPRPGARHRIEHCAVTDDAALDRIARLGLIPVPQGRFVHELGDGMAAALGPDRTRWCYRQAAFLARGIPLPGSSDRPVVDGAPLRGIADLVLRRTAAGRRFSSRGGADAAAGAARLDPRVGVRHLPGARQGQPRGRQARRPRGAVRRPDRGRPGGDRRPAGARHRRRRRAAARRGAQRSARPRALSSRSSWPSVSTYGGQKASVLAPSGRGDHARPRSSRCTRLPRPRRPAARPPTPPRRRAPRPPDPAPGARAAPPRAGHRAPGPGRRAPRRRAAAGSPAPPRRRPGGR